MGHTYTHLYHGMFKPVQAKPEVAARLQLQALQVARFVSFLPWVRSIWLTGRSALPFVDEQDDLDFLVITDSHRLWLTRLVVIASSSLLGKYQKRGASQPGRWCFNLWLTSNSLELPLGRRTLYHARELAQAKLLWARGRQEASELFFANRWMVLWCRNGFSHQMNTARRYVFSTRLSTLFSDIFAKINSLAYYFQRSRWQDKQVASSEFIDMEAAFFHPLDRSASLKIKWEKAVQMAGLPPVSWTMRKYPSWLSKLSNGRGVNGAASVAFNAASNVNQKKWC